MIARLLAVCALALLVAGCGDSSSGGGSAGAEGLNNPNEAAVATAPLGGVNSAALSQPGQVGPRGVHYLAPGVEDRVFFDTDASQLTAEARATLSRQSAWLAQNPQISVVIAGNCDERGTEEYNFALGQRRANAARDYLVSLGVGAQRIQTISYGKTRPSAVGSTPEAWAQNRNAITSPAGGQPAS